MEHSPHDKTPSPKFGTWAEPEDVFIGPTVSGETITVYFDTIREAIPNPEISDEQIEKIAQTLAAQAEATSRAERPRQRRREWILLIIGLIAGAILSIPIGMWVNSIS